MRGLGSLFRALGKRLTGKTPRPTATAEAEAQALSRTTTQSVDEAIIAGKQKPVAPQARPPMKLDDSGFYQGPLNMGVKGTRPEYGSQTYDWIAAKGKGEFSADEWLNHLLDIRKKEFRGPFGGKFKKTTVNPRQFDYGKNYNGVNLFNEVFPGNNRGRVSIEELFDAGIAGFDKQGNLTSGLLFSAQQNGLKLTREQLGRMIKEQPVNNLKTVIYDSSISAKGLKEMQDASADFLNKTVVLKEAATPTERGALSDARGAINVLFKDVQGMDSKAIKYQLDTAMENLLVLRDAATPASAQRVNHMIGKVGKAIEDMKNVKSTKYGDQNSYTLMGGENYREMVVKMPGPIERNTDPLRSMSHFSDEKNSLYFSRFDTRYTQDGKKVLFIHDVQSDANQKIAKTLRKEGMTGFEGYAPRINPFAEEMNLQMLTAEKQKLLNQLKNLTPGDSEKIGIIASKINKIEKAMGGYTKANYSGKYREYYPFLDRSAYGNHALRTFMKKAANEGYDYVAIAPYEKVAIRMHGDYKAGNEAFYGSAFGKGQGGKGEGIMPKLMKQNAKFHGTSAGPIKIAYSDPKKPFKIIKDAADNTGNDAHGKRRSRAFFEHVKSFKSVEDAVKYGASNKIKEVRPDDPALYFDAFAIKLTPEMRQAPIQMYHEGGLVVDMFKPL